jgi:hypothetical protein
VGLGREALIVLAAAQAPLPAVHASTLPVLESVQNNAPPAEAIEMACARTNCVGVAQELLTPGEHNMIADCVTAFVPLQYRLAPLVAKLLIPPDCATTPAPDVQPPVGQDKMWPVEL